VKLNEAVRAVLRARTDAATDEQRLTGDDVVRVVMEAIAGEHEPPKSASPDRIGRLLSEDSFADLVEAKRWEAFCKALQSLLATQSAAKRKHVKPSPDVTIEQVARAGGVSVDEARDAVGYAIEQGAVEEVGRGKSKRYRLTLRGTSMLSGGLGGLAGRQARIAKARKTLAEAGVQVATDEGES
jgi:hypothetical protein